jgi:hypothetical protein
MKLNNPTSKQRFQLFYLIVFLACCLILFMKPEYTRPLDAPRAIKPYIQSDQIGILEPEDDNQTMRYSAQFWLAPTLIVASDPFCCEKLIAHASLLPVADYVEVMVIDDEWYLLERR